MNRELVPPQNLYQMPRRPSSRLCRLALPAMRHLLLYRFVPSPRSYRHNRGSTAIATASHARRFRAEGVGRRATGLGCGSRGGVVMNVTAEVPALLAFDAGVRETGWAVFKDGEVIESGVSGEFLSRPKYWSLGFLKSPISDIILSCSAGSRCTGYSYLPWALL